MTCLCLWCSLNAIIIISFCCGINCDWSHESTPSYSSSHVTIVTLILSLYYAVFTSTNSFCEQNLTPLTDECVCPGDSLQLTCTVAGGGTTVWRVGQQCTIVLDHLRFVNGVTMSCDDIVDAPSVTGSSLSVVGDCYTSQVTITITSDLNGMSASCEHDDGTNNTEYIGNYQIILTSGKNYSVFCIIITFIALSL